MKTILFPFVLLVAISFSSCEKDEPVDPSPIVEIPDTGNVGDTLLQSNLDYLVAKQEIPGIAVLTVDGSGIIESGVSGRTIMGNNEKVALLSQWHIGSITKSMTATLVGILVEKGYLTWETTISDIVDEGYLPEYGNVTFEQLLSHTSGILANDYPVDPNDSRPISVIRQEWSITVLNIPRNDGFTYSNNGYVVAGTLLELITGETWEQLMIEHLFQPLEMTETGFGVPGNDGSPNQPWGHQFNNGQWSPVDPMDIMADNPAALGPAGTIKTTLADLEKYIQLHLGNTDVIQSGTLEKLHTEVSGSGYALGWNVTDNGVFHSGSNARWFAQLFISKEDQFANFAVTNSYDADGNISIPSVLEALQLMAERLLNAQ
nr:serine hydrolase domain-containing protein [Allomuricauda sp.]